MGKIPVSFEGVDTMSLTAHKFYGLNGIGLLLKRRRLALEPPIHGGESTTIYRSGTPTVADVYKRQISWTFARHRSRVQLVFTAP